MKLFVLLLMLPAFVFAGDKVGNGGGLWACESNNKINQASLVDIFEAQDEFGLKMFMPASNNQFDIADEVLKRISKALPNYYKDWADTYNATIAKIRYVNTELVIVEDSLCRSKPLPALCSSGWKYMQFANYTHFDDVLIRNDLWNEPVISNFDKAALLWHEAIYRWFRVKFKDENSVRARRVVGIIFSDLPTNEMQIEIEKIVNNSMTPINAQWLCYVRNSNTYEYFYEFGKNELLASNSTMEKCKASSAQFSFHCADYALKCEQVQASTDEYDCIAKNKVSGKVFVSTAQNLFEAKVKAVTDCSKDLNWSVHCTDFDDLMCSK